MNLSVDVPTNAALPLNLVELRKKIGAIMAAPEADVLAHFRRILPLVADREAVTYLERGEEPGACVTFAEMDRQARSLAAYFQELGLAGERAVMIFDASVDSVVVLMGCIYGKVIAVPLPAPSSSRPDRFLMRVKNVIDDSDAAVILSTAATRDRLQVAVETMPALGRLRWICVDTLPDRSKDWSCPQVSPDDIVYLQYTSGSTSVPKGVMVTHHNLMKSLALKSKVLGFLEYGTGTVCWMPYFHDFAMVEGIFTTLAHGLPLWIISPLDFVARPMRWVNAIHRFRASHSSSPNFAFDLLVNKSTPEERARLDLTCWHRASNGGEFVRASTLDRMLRTFGPHGLSPKTVSPVYGLAEATLLVTMTEGVPRTFSVDAAALEQHRVVFRSESEPGTRSMVGSGRVWPGQWELDIRIVDPDTCRLVPADGVGEVWISGDVVAAGYWRRPETTREKFHARIVDLPGRLYHRSGDLAFWAGDELVITGRIKDMIILGGRNIYPHDIELTANAAAPALRLGCTIVFSTADDDDMLAKVVLVSELRPGHRLVDEPVDSLPDGEIPVVRSDLERAVRRAVSDDHQVRLDDIVVLPAGLLPKTTSGKLERSQCRALYLRGALLNSVPRLPEIIR